MSTKPTSIKAEPGQQNITIQREFDAPRHLVYEAFTDPSIVTQWLGPKDIQMRIEKYEAKTGGSYRYIHFRTPGIEYAFNGVFHECTAPERIIQTWEFEGLPERGHVGLGTSLFEELPGDRTLVTIHSVYQSHADRDAALASGMEKGILDSHERLDEVLLRQR